MLPRLNSKFDWFQYFSVSSEYHRENPNQLISQAGIQLKQWIIAKKTVFTTDQISWFSDKQVEWFRLISKLINKQFLQCFTRAWYGKCQKTNVIDWNRAEMNNYDETSPWTTWSSSFMHGNPSLIVVDIRMNGHP